MILITVEASRFPTAAKVSGSDKKKTVAVGHPPRGYPTNSTSTIQAKASVIQSSLPSKDQRYSILFASRILFLQDIVEKSECVLGT